MFPTKSKLDEMHHMNFKMKKPNDPKLETHPMIRPQKSNTLFESPLMKFTKQSNLKISDKVAENFKSIGLKSDAKAAKEAAEQKAFSALRTSCRSSSGYTKVLTRKINCIDSTYYKLINFTMFKYFFCSNLDFDPKQNLRLDCGEHSKLSS